MLDALDDEPTAQANEPRPVGLRITKLADRSAGTRETRFDPTTGQKYLHNPATGGAEPWPLAGIRVEGVNGDPCPAVIGVGTTVVDTGRAEGWIDVEGEQVVHRPGGPAEDRWRVTHTFRHYDTLIFKTADGDLRYRVTHQPDKYAVDDDETPVTDEVYADGGTRVDWFYRAELED